MVGTYMVVRNPSWDSDLELLKMCYGYTGKVWDLREAVARKAFQLDVHELDELWRRGEVGSLWLVAQSTSPLLGRCIE